LVLLRFSALMTHRTKLTICDLSLLKFVIVCPLRALFGHLSRNGAVHAERARVKVEVSRTLQTVVAGRAISAPLSLRSCAIDQTELTWIAQILFASYAIAATGTPIVGAHFATSRAKKTVWAGQA
jgi:hypothetical protein